MFVVYTKYFSVYFSYKLNTLYHILYVNTLYTKYIIPCTICKKRAMFIVYTKYFSVNI